MCKYARNTRIFNVRLAINYDQKKISQKSELQHIGIDPYFMMLC